MIAVAVKDYDMTALAVLESLISQQWHYHIIQYDSCGGIRVHDMTALAVLENIL